MKKILATLAAVALPLAVAAPAHAYPPPYDFYDHPYQYEIRVHQDDFACDPPYGTCQTELLIESPYYYSNDDDGGYAYAYDTLTNVNTGQVVPTAASPADLLDEPEVITGTTTDGPLAAGTYTYQVDFDRPGYWSCSIYDPDGCSWNSEDEATFLYRFTYDGSTPVVALPYRAPAARASPSVPRSPRVTASSHRALLRWTAPRTANPAVGYYQVQRGSALRTRHSVGRLRYARFSGLTNGHRYPFYVRAHNRLGFSNWVKAYGTPRR